MSPHLRKLFLSWLCAVFLVTCLAIHGGETRLGAQWLIDAWGIENGLPQSTVLSIEQTPDGYLWLATFNGLARFDGMHFTVFNPVNTPELGSEQILQVNVDRWGNLWIGTVDGRLSCYADGKFELCDGKLGLPPSPVFAQGLDPDGRFWVIGAGQGSPGFRFDGKTFIPTPTGPEGIEKRVPEIVTARHRGWLKVDGEWVLGGPKKLRDYGATNGLKFLFGLEGPAWIVSSNEIQRADGRSKQRLSRDILRADLTEAAADNRGNVFIGSWAEGLFVVTNGQVEKLPLTRGVAPERVRTLFLDREGNMWVGTDVSGLARIKAATFRTVGREVGLRGGIMKSVAEAGDGAMWFVNEQGIDRMAPDGSVMKMWDDSQMWTMTMDKDGEAWSGSYAGGVRKHPLSGPIRTELVGNMPVGLRVLTARRAGGVWAGAPNGLWRTEGLKLVEEPLPADLPVKEVRAIIEEPNGDLWIGLNGAGLLQRESGNWHRYTKKDGLVDERVVALYEDRAGTLWIGGPMGGLECFAKGKFTAFGAMSGGLPAMVSGIAEDDFGNLWLASLDGIHRVSKVDLQDGDETARPFVIHYNRADGMRSSECASGTQPTIWKARDGRLWFATVDGASVTDPRALPSNTNGPPVHIEEVLVDGKKAESNPLRIPPGAGRVELHFTALTLTSPEKARFKIQMQGSDPDWVDIGTRRVAYYTGLAPGNHTFRVIAANSDGVWNRTGATLALSALPQYWQTLWFKILVAAGWAGLILAWYERRLRRMRLRRAEHQAFSQRLLDVQESERKRIAGELHDSLGQTLLVVKNRAILGSQRADNPSAMTADFEQISKAASDGLQEVRQIAYSLRPFELDRLGLKRAIETMLERVAQSGEVKIDLQIDELNGIIAPGKEIHVYRVCQEAITNVLKHAQARSVSFELRRNGAVAELKIMDDGKGFDVDTVLRDPERGLGLRSMSERVAALHGKFRIDSAPGRGARISVIIGEVGQHSGTKM